MNYNCLKSEFWKLKSISNNITLYEIHENLLKPVEFKKKTVKVILDSSDSISIIRIRLINIYIIK